jgi:hypothetical protein
MDTVKKLDLNLVLSPTDSIDSIFEGFSVEPLWARCTSHSKDLSNNFVEEMMVHSSLYLRVPVGY